MMCGQQGGVIGMCIGRVLDDVWTAGRVIGMCIGRVLDDVWTTGRVIGMCIGRVLDDGLVNSHQLRSEQAPAKGQHRHQGYR
jgi:hypothetical protein